RAGFTAEERRGKGNLLLDFALGIDMEQGVRRELGRVAFRGEPEPAFAVAGDTFKIELLCRVAVSGDYGLAGNSGRFGAGVDRVDRRFRKGAVADGHELA